MTGVLALQGDFAEHVRVLEALGEKATLVRLPADLAKVERLIIPGGESTTIGKLLEQSGLLTAIKKRAKAGMPIWGTCAGAIVLAKHIEGGRADQKSLGLLDITARRNAYGRQQESFETSIMIPTISKKKIAVAFIRAPILTRPGKAVKVLATRGKEIIAVQQGDLLATTFHPEIPGSKQFHYYFLNMGSH
ncbi:MAG: pyridoxal 5'-phosphate synthase glutaminase subunit PdxT [Candidatus Kaiserbacteria bacterium]|nr:MAG: pyridoxal 5'-phosphate synthase glutaminase subunit PdxT [Candidatus Kaiserbacteria bacterium]